MASFLLKLIEYAEANGIDYKNTSISKAICIGESLRNEDFSLTTLGQRIKDKWDIPGGRITPGTDLLTNLKREIVEEVGDLAISEINSFQLKT